MGFNSGFKGLIWRMHFVYRMTKDKGTHSEYVILLFSHGNNGYANVPQFYVIRKFPALFFTILTIRSRYFTIQQ